MASSSNGAQAPSASVSAASAALQAAHFIEDVDAYMRGQRLEVKLGELEGQLRAFKQQEQALQVRRLRLQERLPEIKLALEAVVGLLARADEVDGDGGGAPLLVDYELTEGMYAKAALQHVDSVNLWLGANVMVEYPLAEARALLEQQQAVCEGSLESISAELEATKSSVAITEVSMARVFNWDVEQRRKAKAAAEQQPGGAPAAVAAS